MKQGPPKLNLPKPRLQSKSCQIQSRQSRCGSAYNRQGGPGEHSESQVAPTAKAAKSVVTPKIALAKLRRASAVKARAALASAPAANPAAAEAVKHAIEATEKSKRANATSLPLPAALLARPAPRQVLAKMKSKAQALPKRGVRLYDLRESHCRWVLDREGQEPAFCGAPKVGSSSWCAAHRKIVYPRATSQDGAPANGKAERPAASFKLD